MEPRPTNPDPRCVYLTFDDGPCHPFTPDILDVLKSRDVKATFFVCGMNVERHPDLARRIVAEGHSIGNHTYSHSKSRAFLGMWGNEIRVTERAIEKATGVRPTIFRPPWGMNGRWLAPQMKRAGYQTFLWDVQARDWERPAPDIILERISRRVRPGSIILLHDGEQALAKTDRSRTAAALPAIIDRVTADGFTFGCL